MRHISRRAGQAWLQPASYRVGTGWETRGHGCLIACVGDEAALDVCHRTCIRAVGVVESARAKLSQSRLHEAQYGRQGVSLALYVQ